MMQNTFYWEAARYISVAIIPGAGACLLYTSELREQKKQVAVKDAHHIATLMAEFLEADLHRYLPGNDREAFCILLSDFQKVIKEGK